jgi:DNA-binding LacI/PurR family transcriptional regulator
MRDSKSIGSLLRQHRVQRGLRQDDLAALAGYTGASRHAIVSKIEATGSEKFADPAQIAKIVRALHQERHLNLSEIHQLATTYLGLDNLHEAGERSHVGVVIAGVAFSSFWSAAVASIAMRAAPVYNLILRTHGEDLAVEREILRSFLERAHSLSAVILAPAQGLYHGPSPRQSEMRRRLIRELQESDVPVILIDRSLPSADQNALRTHAPVVSLDNYDGSRKAIRKLCEAGHRQIGILLDMEHDITQQERLRGAADEMQAQGLDIDKRLIVFGTAGPQVDSSALGANPFGFHNARMNTGALLGQRRGGAAITALFCTTEYVTLEAYTAIVNDYRMRIPEQFTLLGHDEVRELRRLGISHVPYSPNDLAMFAVDKVRDYRDPSRLYQAHRYHLWQVNYTAPEWTISTTNDAGTVRDIRERADSAASLA